ncbi:putative ABC transporter [Nostocoides japonicum T1-X7]|uniref:Putative ABC transporter n=1 Tax=Nostocoides japonicum T1-X7 TaxID=1194083 RepID=A0A077LYB2_9MICO|nr:ABC transporter ATP-binding protein [Tetrasphaera japonica]CCH78636.1 putative ABC transporter [Tetrasphaera japonica T1-X7]
MKVETDKTRRTLPVSDSRAVRRHAGGLLARHRGYLALVLGLHVLAALAALASPWLVGRLVDVVSGHAGRVGTSGDVDRVVGLLVVAVLVQTVLTWAARRSAFILGETVFAELRETFIGRAIHLPLSTIERAGTGDLVARTTQDVEALSHVARFGLPAVIVGLVTVVLTVATALATSWLAALPIFLSLLLLVPTTRRYLKVAVPGYLWERASYAELSGVVAETVDGARTVDALRLGAARRRRFREVLQECNEAEKYTLRIRLWYFPLAELSYHLPLAATMLWAGWLAIGGHVTLGAATAVVLYVRQVADPLDDVISWLDEIQVGVSSLARIVGVGEVPPDRTATGALPVGTDIEVDDVRYAYRAGHDVLRGVSLDLRPGERLAVVGPSGAGKSTLGRLMAGIDGPRTGAITVGGVPLVDLELGRLRGEVALVTQEHHVFVGTLEENLRLARPGATHEELYAALAAVDAAGWAVALPAGLDTVVGSGGHPLSEPQAQQLALARLVLADPHTLVLDEATSLLDPRAARHLERSLAAVVAGRTVVAIAHRLHTAHDADRVAVVEDGLVSELGSHEELMEHGGAYADLWRSWTQDATAPATHP